MASTSRHASSSYGVGGSTIVQSTAAAADLEEDQSPINLDRERDVYSRSPVDVSRHPTVYENNGHGQGHDQQHLREPDFQTGYPSRPPSAQPNRRSANVSRMGTSRVDSPTSDITYPSWLPRRPLAPAPPSESGGTGHGRTGSAAGYYGGGGRLADLFNFSRGHSRNVTQSTNRVSTAMSGFITNPSEYGGPTGRRTTDGSVGRKETGGSGGTNPYEGRKGSSGDNEAGVYGHRRGNSRSVRIAPGSVDHGRGQEPTDQTRRPSSSAQGYTYSHVRGFSRGAINPYAAAMLSQSPLDLHPPNQGWMSATPPLGPPAPRFRARNLNLSLMRSPSKLIRLRYLLQPISYFAHIPVQLFFDFNVVYMLVQITKYPTPLAPGVPNTTPSPSWLFALIAYLIATFLWLIGVVVIYEIAWCFWRRWRVKRPGMLGIFSSRPARKLVGMGSFDRFCFLEYVQRGAWTDRTELDMMMERDRELEEEEERESMGGGWEGKEALRNARAEELQQQQQQTERAETREPRDIDDDADTRSLSWPGKLRLLNYRQGFIEWAWNRSQNLPTVSLLIPRACIAFIIILAFTKVNPLTQAALNNGSVASTPSVFGTVNPSSYPSNDSPASRDSAFFSSSDGTLTGYAKAVLWIDCVWALWRVLVLVGAYIALWLASGQSCAGVCGPRYRWEETERQEWEDATNAGLAEKYGSGSRRHLSLSGESTVGGIDTERGDIADQLGWEWRENTRRRVREAYEFCLLTPLPHRRHHGSLSVAPPHQKDTDDSQSPAPLTALEQALLASRHQGRGKLGADLFEKPDGTIVKKDSLQLVPPPGHLQLTKANPNSRSAPITQLPYPLSAYQPGMPITRRDSVPFPSPEPHGRHDDPEVEELEGMEGMTASQMEEMVAEEDRRYLEDADYVEGEADEMGYIKDRPDSASLSSLGQPIHPRLQFVGHHTRGSVSTGVGGSYQSPRNSGYVSSKSTSGDQGRRKSSGKSSGSQYSPHSPRTHKSSGSQQSPTDSSDQRRGHLVNILPPPSAGGQRQERRRAGQASSANPMPPIPSPIPTEDLTRTRTRSSHAASSGVYEVNPQPAFEHSDEEEGEEHEAAHEGEEDLGLEEEIIIGDDQEDPEHEDSVGLLSQTPSHQGSLAALRQRASSLSNSIHRLRTRSQGAASQSNSNSGSGEARSRTRSLAAQQQRPESHAMSSLGSASRSRSTSHSRSRTSSLVPQIGARYTSSRPTEFGVMRGGNGGNSGSGGDLMHFAGGETEDDRALPPLPPLPESAQPRLRAGSTAPSERTIQNLSQQQQQPPGRLSVHPNVSLDIEHPDISEARESFVTLPPSVDTASTHVHRAGGRGAQGPSGHNESSQTVSTWANVPGYLHDPAPHP